MYQKQEREKLRDIWNKFQSGKPFETKDIRKEILDSWKRCKQYQVDPYNPYGSMKTLSYEDIKKYQEKNKELISAANDYLNTLYNIISSRESTVILTDREGITILLIGNQEILLERKELGLGAVTLEEQIGTNGPGTCLYLNKPFQISAEEHYCQVNQKYFCTAAPICDPQGELIGCINISGISEIFHTYALYIVIGAAESIERQLRINKVMKQNQMIISQQNIILDIIPHAILMLDTNGNIKHINKKALQMFNITKEKVLNTSVNDLILSGIDISTIKEARYKTQDMEVDITLPNGDLLCRLTTEITRDDKGSIQNIILSFKENEHIHELVNKVSGSRSKYTFEQMCGESDVLKKVIRQGKLVAQTNSRVLITGESGTGKELMAQSIHNASKRSHKPFITINCGALPRELIESELFGYVGGAFTGAKKEGNPGKFELADGGTIFLDEIGDMPLDVQVTLLRVIQEQEVTRIGANKPKKIDVKVIAATNKNLELEVKNKFFRHDLYYRLNVFEIYLPPLRERKDDVTLLIEKILNRIRKEINKQDLVITNEAMECLYAYDWPGNIRQLENVLERAANFCRESVISCNDFPFYGHNIAFSQKTTEQRGLYLRESNLLEAKLITDTLMNTQGNLKIAAQKLGIARSTIYRKLKQYGISAQNYRNIE